MVKKYIAGKITGKWIEVYAVGSTKLAAYKAARIAGLDHVTILKVDDSTADKAAARIKAGWKFLHHLSGDVFSGAGVNGC